jgi:carbonic anhydrase
MNISDKLLQNNREWAERIREEDPSFFDRLSQQQSPEVLWIGCSDSRVPANQITGLMPGEVFVHRNIANLVLHSDINCQAVMQFAIEVLKVKHVIVCGHYGCGGVRAALQHRDHGLIHHWLRNIKDVYHRNRAEFPNDMDEDAKVDRLCELNVKAQAEHVARSNTVENAWARGQDLQVYGWIYSIQDGLLKDLGVHFAGPEDVPDVYHTDG